MAKERLQKLLAQANIASRRASEDLISHGRVKVNGVVAKLGDKADPQTDEILVDGARLKFDAQKHLYIALHKPKQVLSTDKPHRTDKRQTVMDLIGLDEHLFSIGRLDADSEGLVVMTNDGDLAQRLSHPRYRHTKTYRVDILGLPTAETLEKWQQGVFLEDGKTAPCFVEVVKGSVKGTTLRIVMTEGKKRQIRRVAALLGHPVKRLIRTHLGMFALGDLAPGQWRELTPPEVVALSTPSPEIKTIRAQIARRPTASASADNITKPSAETARPRRVPRVPRAKRDPDAEVVPETQEERTARRERKKALAQETTGVSPETQPKRRTARVRKTDSHDDKWGKPSVKPSAKPTSRKSSKGKPSAKPSAAGNRKPRSSRKDQPR